MKEIENDKKYNFRFRKRNKFKYAKLTENFLMERIRK